MFITSKIARSQNSFKKENKDVKILLPRYIWPSLYRGHDQLYF